MNRFRTRRKAKEALEANGDSLPPSIPSPPSKAFRKNKKAAKHVEPEVDLSTALPSSDEFRTSLLMPNLSARFSMLREQDDPNSLIGKANDDSVLFPKRSSRLNLFATNGLSDIAEVESLKGSIRPPFATADRSNSFDGGYGTDDDSNYGGSIMSRSKPGQGNNLFGGRQKLYQIPIGGTSSKNVSSGTPIADSGMSGRLVYENDVTQSAFQRWKQREREQAQASDDDDLHHDQTQSNEETESISSPSTAFSRNRGTISSTNSAPSNKRTSTAATSIESQPTNTSQLAKSNSQSQSQLDRQATIHKRLYGQALDQGPSRDVLENYTRKRTGSNDKTANPLLHSKSATNINERLRIAPVYSSSSTALFRATSPSPSTSSPAQTPIDRISRDSDSIGKNFAQPFGYIPPLSPPISEAGSGTTLSNSVQPEDRGKATAMGLFNKPSRQYDETQFSQRQMQMHVERNGTILRRASPPTGALPGLPTTTTASRASSDASSTKSYPQSMASEQQRESPKPIMRNQPSTLPTVSGSPPETDIGGGTFLDTLSQSEDSEADEPVSIDSVQQDVSGVPPALLSSQDFDVSEVPDEHLPAIEKDEVLPQDIGIEAEENHEPASRVISNSPDSPTLGPVGGLGGMVRTHLRQDSERSNQPPSPLYPPANSNLSAPGQQSQLDNNDADDRDEPDHSPKLNDQVSTMSMSEKARQILGQTSALREQQKLKAQRVLGENLPKYNEESQPSRSWQEEMELHHQRNGSSESQRDREEFENQLAERRRRVQENLKSIADTSRAASPAPAPSSDEVPNRSQSTFAKLRPRPSKANTSESSSKAMKMLGIGSSTMNTSSSKPPTTQLLGEDDQAIQDVSTRLVPRRPRSPLPPPTYHGLPQKSADGQQADDVDDMDEDFEEKDQSSSLPRSRNEKAHIGRPRLPQHRTGRQRDDLGPHPSERSASAASGLIYPVSHQGPYPAETGYFDSKSSSSSNGTNVIDRGATRPSPFPPYSANSTPPLVMDRSPMLHGVEKLPIGSHSTPHLPLQQSQKWPVKRGMSSTPTLASPTYVTSPSGIPQGDQSRYGPEYLMTSVYRSSPDQRDGSPPVPAMNPRRRRPTLTYQNDHLAPIDRPQMPRSADHLHVHSPQYNDDLVSPASAVSASGALEEQSNHHDGGARRSPPQTRRKLRKSSSEGGNMNSRARAERMKSERSPGLPPMRSPTPVQSPQYPVQRPYSPAMGPNPTSRSRTPSFGHQALYQGSPRGPPMTGMPMGWQEFAAPPTMISGPQGRSSPGPSQMRMEQPSMAGSNGGHPMRLVGIPGTMHGQGPSDGRSTPIGQRMRAPSRQRQIPVDGPMF